MTQQILLQPAYLLHRRAYRETSALVDLLTLTHGRISAVIKGARNKKWRQALHFFTPLQVSWQGQRDLKLLTAIEAVAPGPLLVGEAVLCALYANELLVRCLPQEFSVEALFAHYSLLMHDIVKVTLRAPRLRRLEVTLLEALDAEPRFVDELLQPLQAQRHYSYDVQNRCFFADSANKTTIDGRTLIYLAQDQWESPQLANLSKKILRQALAPLLGNKPLHSRTLFNQLLQHRFQQRTRSIS